MSYRKWSSFSPTCQHAQIFKWKRWPIQITPFTAEPVQRSLVEKDPRVSAEVAGELNNCELMTGPNAALHGCLSPALQRRDRSEKMASGIDYNFGYYLVYKLRYGVILLACPFSSSKVADRWTPVRSSTNPRWDQHSFVRESQAPLERGRTSCASD